MYTILVQSTRGRISDLFVSVVILSGVRPRVEKMDLRRALVVCAVVEFGPRRDVFIGLTATGLR